MATYWPHVREFLERALHKAGGDAYAGLEHLVMPLARGEQRMALVFDGADIAGALTYRLGQHARCREMELLLLGGTNMAAWGKQLWTWVRAEALRNGCSMVTGGGRPEWGAWLRRYAKDHEIHERRIYNVRI